ncbi:MAG: hypothetical protein OES69_14655, partial [Myxococcales bacterium]|nr:hypothetical protein [Myxococcales bacterium]
AVTGGVGAHPRSVSSFTSLATSRPFEPKQSLGSFLLLLSLVRFLVVVFLVFAAMLRVSYSQLVAPLLV